MPYYFYIIIAWVVCSFIIAFLGARFRFGFWGYLFGSLLLSPIIGLFLLAAAIPRRPRKLSAGR